MLPRPLLITNPPLPIIPIDKIKHNTPALKNPNRLPIRKRIRQRGDAAVGVDFEVPRLLLRILGELDLGRFVGQGELFEGDGDLDAVRGLGCVEVDVGGLGVGGHDLGGVGWIGGGGGGAEFCCSVDLGVLDWGFCYR